MPAEPGAAGPRGNCPRPECSAGARGWGPDASAPPRDRYRRRRQPGPAEGSTPRRPEPAGRDSQDRPARESSPPRGCGRRRPCRERAGVCMAGAAAVHARWRRAPRSACDRGVRERAPPRIQGPGFLLAPARGAGQQGAAGAGGPAARPRRGPAREGARGPRPPRSRPRDRGKGRPSPGPRGRGPRWSQGGAHARGGARSCTRRGRMFSSAGAARPWPRGLRLGPAGPASDLQGCEVGGGGRA